MPRIFAVIFDGSAFSYLLANANTAATVLRKPRNKWYAYPRMQL